MSRFFLTITVLALHLKFALCCHPQPQQTVSVIIIVTILNLQYHDIFKDCICYLKKNQE